MDYTTKEILQYIEENDVKFVRLFFCDIFGIPKNIAILASQLAHAFTYGIGFDASAVDGFLNIEESDLLLFPDPKTLAVLPWRPSTGRVVRFFCDIRHPDGTPFAGDGRYLIRCAQQKAREIGFECRFGAECEFYLFEMDEQGNPTTRPHDRAGYLDIAPLDRGENVRREICLSLEEMGIEPESSHHEKGPGQNEVDFKYSDAAGCADDFITFKSVVRTIAARNGLFATFMPKPIAGKNGSGMHIHMSLFQNGQNLFIRKEEEHNEIAHRFMAGVMRRVAEMTVFLNPSTNSYKRLGSFEAPKYVTWARGNRSQLLRVPKTGGDFSHVELRSPDPQCNPYLAFTLLIEAGLEGISESAALCAPVNFDLRSADAATLSRFETLPATLGEAVQLAKQSPFIQQSLLAPVASKMLACKEEEWQAYQNADNPEAFERARYFEHL